MLEGFMITLREGLEAFLIVGLSIAFLRKSNRRHLESAVHWGIVFSVIVCLAAGVLLYQVAFNQAFWEGAFSLIAAVFVGSLTIHMWRSGKTIKKDLESRLSLASEASQGWGAYWAVFLFTVLMISREGIETALLLSSLMFQVATRSMFIGAVLGVLASALMAYLWSRLGHRVNLSRFFQVTAVFLFVFVVQLLVYSFHEFAEASLFPNSDYLHELTEPLGPDGKYGKFLTYGLVFLPATWLFLSRLFDRKPLTQKQATQA